MEEKKLYLKGTIDSLNKEAIETQNHHVDVFDRRFVVYSGVHSPKYFSDTAIFAELLPIKPDERFLEMGCGAGIISVFACVRGAKEVVAVDINPDAVKNAGENIFFHGFGRKAKCLKSNLFSALKGEAFDTIFWNMPFVHIGKDKLSMHERTVFDPNYKNFEKFAREAKKHLLPGGRLLIGFSKEIGDSKQLRTILEKNKFSLKIIANANAPLARGSEIPVTFQIVEAKPVE